MAAPWWDPNTFGIWVGALRGGVGGPLAGLLGALAGWLAPQGRGRTWILGGLLALTAFGVASLGFGLVALAFRQPYGIWFPMLLLGFIFTVVCGVNLPVLRRAYDAAEQRRIEAEGIRRG